MIALFVAQVAIVLGLLVTQLANYWFTYGIWPKSWISFVACGLISIMLMTLSSTLNGEARK